MIYDWPILLCNVDYIDHGNLKHHASKCIIWASSFYVRFSIVLYASVVIRSINEPKLNPLVGQHQPPLRTHVSELILHSRQLAYGIGHDLILVLSWIQNDDVFEQRLARFGILNKRIVKIALFGRDVSETNALLHDLTRPHKFLRLIVANLLHRSFPRIFWWIFHYILGYGAKVTVESMVYLFHMYL